MKKLTLSLLLSSSLIINTFTTQDLTTNIGPLQIITSDGSNEFLPGTINLSGIINIGQNTTDIINFKGAGIASPTDINSTAVLMINSQGEMTTIYGSNPINFSNLSTGSLTAGANGESIALGSTQSSFTIASKDIITGSNNLLATDINGNLINSTDFTQATIGSLNAASISGQSITLGSGSLGGTGNSLNFTSDTGDISLQANSTGSNLNLTANKNINITETTCNSSIIINNTGSINLETNSIDPNNNSNINLTTNGASGSGPNSKSITINSAGYVYLNGTNINQNRVLKISSTGNIYTDVSATLSLDSVSAAADTSQTVSLGIPDTSHNYFALTSDSGDIIIGANNANSNLNLSAANNIVLTSPGIILPINGIKILSIDNTGNIKTINDNTDPITFGDVTCNSLTAANNTGEIISLGMPSNNYINFIADNGNITLQANATGSNLNLGSNGHINLATSADIINANNFNVLVTDINGNILTANSDTQVTLGSITTNELLTSSITATTGNISTLIAGGFVDHTISLGLSDGNNNTINFTTGSGNLNIQANANNANLNLAANNNINLIGTGIIYPQTGISLLVIDNFGNLSTATNSSDAITFGNITCNNLTAGTNPGESIILGNSTGTFNIASTNISTGSNNLLATDTNGNLITANSSINAQLNNISANLFSGSSANIGQSLANFFSIFGASNDIILKANANDANLNLSANLNVNLSGTELNLTNFININPTANTNGCTVLSIDRSGNIITSNKANLFQIGSDASGNNFIAIDNEIPANGITFNSNNIYLKNQDLTPAAGYTNILTIDENGKIGIVVSSATYKENIKSITKNNSIDKLNPCAYNYKGKKQIKYGLIAEELAKIKELEHAVIYDRHGNAMSVDYNAILTALLANYLQTKKELKAELKMKDEYLTQLIKRLELLENIITQITNQNTSK